MATKFYLRDTTTSVGGSLPGAGTQSATTPSVSASGADTNRVLDTVKGASQQAPTLTSLTGTTLQTWRFRRFVSAPLKAATFGTGNWVIAGAIKTANVNSGAKGLDGVLYIWRPSTGTRIGYIFDSTSAGANTATTAEAAASSTIAGANVTCQDGDVLIFELWHHGTASMSGAVVQTAYYDGTTDASATNNSASLTAPVAIAFQQANTGAATPTGAAVNLAKKPLTGSAGTPTGAAVQIRPKAVTGSLLPGHRGLVQEVAIFSSAAAAAGPAVVTVTGNPTAVGHHLILALAIDANVVTGITDSRGNTWQQDTTVDGTGVTTQIWSARITTALLTGDTISIAYTGSRALGVSVAEYFGLKSTGWYRGGNTGTGLASESAIGTAALPAFLQTQDFLVGAIGLSGSIVGDVSTNNVPNTLGGNTGGQLHPVKPQHRAFSDDGAQVNLSFTWTTVRNWAAVHGVYIAADPLPIIRQANLRKSGGATPAGTAAQTGKKPLTGSAGTPVGTTIQTGKKLLAGAETPTATVTPSYTASRSLTGSETPAGSPIDQVIKRLGGGATPAGSIADQVAKQLAGAATPAGQPRNAPQKPLTGSAGTPTGADVLTPKKLTSGGIPVGHKGFVQEVGVYMSPAFEGPDSILTVTAANPVKVGNHLILWVGSNAALTGVVDSKGNTYQRDLLVSGDPTLSLYSARVTTALVAGDTITLQHGVTVSVGVSVGEYQGLAATNWFRIAASSSGTGTASDSTGLSASAQGEDFLVGAVTTDTGVTGNNYVVAGSHSPAWVKNTLGAATSSSAPFPVQPAHRDPGHETASWNIQFTWTTSRPWASATAAYKEAAPDLIRTASVFKAGGATPAGSLAKQAQARISGSRKTDPKWSLSVVGATTGNLTFTINVPGDSARGTTVIPFNATAAQVKSAFESCGVTITGDLGYTAQASGGPLNTAPVLIEYVGKLAGIAVTASISGSSTADGVKTLTQTQVGGNPADTGAVVKVPAKLLAGAETPTAVVIERPAKVLSGGVTPSGSVVRLIAITLSGAVVPTGSMSKRGQRLLTGSAQPSSVLIDRVIINLAGHVTSSGVIPNKVELELAGIITPSGAVNRSIGVDLDGAVDMAGALDTFIDKHLGGSIRPTGEVTTVGGTPVVPTRRRRELWISQKPAISPVETELRVKWSILGIVEQALADGYRIMGFVEARDAGTWRTRGFTGDQIDDSWSVLDLDQVTKSNREILAYEIDPDLLALRGKRWQ